MIGTRIVRSTCTKYELPADAVDECSSLHSSTTAEKWEYRSTGMKGRGGIGWSFRTSAVAVSKSRQTPPPGRAPIAIILPSSVRSAAVPPAPAPTRASTPAPVLLLCSLDL